MKNKGFTLVELLAVIVVLSIIALIGYSTVGNIISSTQDNSNKITMKNYAKAVDQAVFLYEMNNPDSTLPDLNSEEWLSNVKFEKATVKCDNITYDKTSSLYGCTVNNSDKTYCYTGDTAVECTPKGISKIYGESIQNGTPTPTSPVEIESVGEKTKNLFDKSAATLGKNLNASTGDLYDSQVRGVSDYIKIDPSKQYTFLYNSNVGTASRYLLCYDENKAFISSCYNIVSGSSSTKWTLEFKSATVKYIRANFFWNVNDSASEINDFMIYEGSNDEVYEPYGYKIPITVSNGSDTKTTNIYLKEPLRKIGEYADYLDLTSKKVVRNIKEVVFNGTEVLTKVDTTSLKTEYIYPQMKLISSNSTSIIWTSTHINLGITTYAPYMPTAIEFRDINRNFNIEYDITKFQAWLKEQYNLNNPMKIDYVLETPTEESIDVPEISSLTGNVTYSIDTPVQPSKIEYRY